MKVSPTTSAPVSLKKETGQPQVHTNSPEEEKVLAEVDSRYFDIASELPSRMAFYPFDHLSVRPYTVSEVVKLGTARKSGKVKYVMEAVGATIDRPVGDLLMCDFMYLCHWLRVMSFKKTPFTLKWFCEANSHRYKVVNDEIPASTLENSVVLDQSNLKVSMLDHTKIEATLNRLMDNGVVAYPQTTRTYLEAEELLSKGKELSDEDTFLAAYAAILSRGEHGNTLQDRIQFLKTLDPEAGIPVMEDLGEVAAYFRTLGVHESLSLECQHCKVKQEVSIDVDLLSFFPFGE